MDRTAQRHTALYGRAAELEHLRGVLSGASAGQFAMVVVSGDPGVGKTALVGALAAQVDDATLVLSGACPPLTSVSVPFLPLISALRAWTAERGETVPDLRPLPGNAAEVVLAFDAWIDRRCAERPMLLVVDDLQWADESTLDVLTYLLAGPDRQLAVVLTLRDSGLPAGHRLRRWMADAVRMPRLTVLGLEPLDRIGVAEQVAGSLGRPARESLVDDVVARGRGNPYLTRLLVEHLTPDAAALPRALPATLGDAVLRSWHALPSAARELAQLLAVGSPHLGSDQIGHIAAAALGCNDVAPLLRDAVDTGLLRMHDDGSYWFRHPLQAELLEAAARPEQRRGWHLAYATLLEETVDSWKPGERSNTEQMAAVAALVAVADHYALTDHLDLAYRAAERAAEAVGSVGGSAEQLRLLDRALTLLPHADGVGETRTGLLSRIRVAAESAGKQEEELAAVELLLAELDPQVAPLDVAELLVRRTDLRTSTGREFAGLDGVREAVRLSARAPRSWQHAYALAELAHSELWHDDPAGAEHAEAAVAAARAAGAPKGLTYALAGQSMALTVAGTPGGQVPAAEAVAAAATARDFWAFCHAALWEANALETSTSRTFVASVRARREQLVALGAPHTYVGWLCASTASGLLSLGDLPACRGELRVALGASPGPMGEVTARLVAALLAVLQGRQAEAEAHLYRAEELYAETSGFLAFEFDSIRAEVALGAGDPRRALEAALIGARAPGLPPTRCEHLLPLAARALADLAVQARDEHRSDAEPLSELDRLRSEFPRVISDVGGPTPLYDLQLAALQSMYDAETMRAHRAPDAGDNWITTADLCGRGDLPWQEAYALWRAAESILPVRASRAAGSDLLRRGRQIAADLEAEPLLRQFDGLARSARVVVEDALSDQDQGAVVSLSRQDGFTPREREVLDLVVTGRTYRDIARALHISEKTVSVHISNLLHKSGATNRIELAVLAQRGSAS